MGTKTTVDNKGVVTKSESGSAITFIVDGKHINKTQNGAVDGAVTADNKGVVVVEANGNTVTASLPAISEDNVGLSYIFVNADNANAMALSGTNPISGSGWEVGTTARATSVLAVSSSAGFGWEILY